MYEKDGEKYFVVDAHTHMWDARPENYRNEEWGKGWIECFYGYHSALSPESEKWTMEEFQYYGPERMAHDLFEKGYVDACVLQSTHLHDFYKTGFNTVERNMTMREQYGDKVIVNGRWDPRDGEDGLADFEEQVKRYGPFKGVKLYTAEFKGSSKGWKLSDPWAIKYLEKTQELGIKNVNLHKGPTVWPLNKDAFSVEDVDDAATRFPELNFIVDHLGLPRLEDFCWIAVQESNVYAGMAVAMPFMYSRPRYFAQMMGELLYWLDEDRILFGSDYAIWEPKWLVEQFVDFQIPEDMQSEYGTLTPDIKRKVLGLNAARLFDIEVPEDLRIPEPVAAGAGYPVEPLK